MAGILKLMIFSGGDEGKKTLFHGERLIRSVDFTLAFQDIYFVFPIVAVQGSVPTGIHFKQPEIKCGGSGSLTDKPADPHIFYPVLNDSGFFNRLTLFYNHDSSWAGTAVPVLDIGFILIHPDQNFNLF
jgi:hypothetical protein